MMCLNFSINGLPKLLGSTGLSCATLVMVTPSIGLSQTGSAGQVTCISHLEKNPNMCVHADYGTVVSMPAGVNTESLTPPQLGPYGFSISQEPAISSNAPQSQPSSIYPGRGNIVESRERGVDRILATSGLQITSDGLTIQPRLGVSTTDMRSSYTGGSKISFKASSNYPAWITQAEIRVTDVTDHRKVIAVIPVEPNGKGTWQLPNSGQTEMAYSLRVYDAQGRYDETGPLPLNRASASQIDQHALTGFITAPGEGVDMAARRRIPITGGAVTVSGQSMNGLPVVIMGETIAVDGTGRFATQRILPVGQHAVSISANGRQVTRAITVPATERFYIGLADLTFGDGYKRGRLAGYGKVRTATGYVFTGAIDTREAEIEDLFDDLLTKSPERVIGRLDDSDVYPTFGDDSASFEDAPTSGNIFARVERDDSYIMWGDFKTAGETARLIGQSRTLYGLSGSYQSTDQTVHGEPRLRLKAYVSNPDRLLQRDVLRGTGGTFYSLKRQDILPDTETIYILQRDRVTGQILNRQMLHRDSDYRINYYQGTVILDRPLAGGASNSGIIGGALSDVTIDLVSEYEYIPAIGDVNGTSTGFRGEVWATNSLRFGLSGQTETTGLADNKIRGGDILWRKSDKTHAIFEYARSEGPGFGRDTSLTGGLDIIGGSGTVSAGRDGTLADAWRVEGHADLAELSDDQLQGSLMAYADRKEQGFVGDGYDVAQTKAGYGVNLSISTGLNSNVSFGHNHLDEKNVGTRSDTELAYISHFGKHITAAFTMGRTERDANGSTSTADVGERTDTALRLGYRWNESTRAWVFVQRTVSVSGQLEDNDRYGVGAKARLTDRIGLSGEISDGDLGAAGSAKISYDDNAGSRYYASYGRELQGHIDDPWSRAPRDFRRNELVLGAERQLGSEFRVYTERKFGEDRRSSSLATDYGVEYTPSDQWRVDVLLSLGKVEYDDGRNRTIDRKGISIGISYSHDDLTAGWRGEYRLDDDSTGSRDRRNWASSAYVRYSLSDDWRLLGSLDASISKSDSGDLRNGTYVEADLGFAYRPVTNDRWNALLRYTYLYDLPGPDQVNIDGDIKGPKQRSHIVSGDTTYDVNEQLTIGVKYGLRLAEIAERNSNKYRSLTTNLGILRVDYHVVHNWDLLAEGRITRTKESGIFEKAGLLGVYRHFGNNLKAGVGYQWGEVSDDLGSLDNGDEGMFFNVIAKF